MSNNFISLVGHVGQAPTSKSFEDTGNKVAKFSFAVKVLSANSDEEKTMWIDVESWNGLADRVLSTVTKGRELVLHGRLAISTYSRDVNGVVVKMTKPVIKLTSYHLCGPKPIAEAESPPEEAIAS